MDDAIESQFLIGKIAVYKLVATNLWDGSQFLIGKIAVNGDKVILILAKQVSIPYR